MHTPLWSTGMMRIGPGLYVDDQHQLHFDAGEFCAHLKISATESNRAMVCNWALEAIRKASPQCEVTYAGDDRDARVLHGRN
jgi:hypothetical protein